LGADSSLDRQAPPGARTADQKRPGGLQLAPAAGRAPAAGQQRAVVPRARFQKAQTDLFGKRPSDWLADADADFTPGSCGETGKNSRSRPVVVAWRWRALRTNWRRHRGAPGPG
jgi:hypothetical protein